MKGPHSHLVIGKQVKEIVANQNVLLDAAKFAVSALAVHNAGGSIESEQNLKRAQLALFRAIESADPAYYGKK